MPVGNANRAEGMMNTMADSEHAGPIASADEGYARIGELVFALAEKADLLAELAGESGTVPPPSPIREAESRIREATALLLRYHIELGKATGVDVSWRFPDVE